MNLFSTKTSKFIIFAFFLVLIGCNDSMKATESIRTNYVDDDDIFHGPDGEPFHLKTKISLTKEQWDYFLFAQWNPATEAEKAYLRQLLVEGLDLVDIENQEVAEKNIEIESRFKLGLFGKRPSSKKGVLAKIREFYDTTPRGEDGSPITSEYFFKHCLCCGENKALDLGIAELYAELKKGTAVDQLSESSRAILNFLYPVPKDSSVRNSNEAPWFRDIFKNFLKHLNHCSKNSRKAGNPRNYKSLVEGVNLFFGIDSSIAKSVSPLSLQSLEGPDTRPIVESLCKHDHCPAFKEYFAVETWSSRLTNGRNLGPIIFGLGILASAGFGVKRWLEIKSSEYKELSRKSKKEKIKKFNRTVIGILTGSALIGFLLFQFLDDQLAVKFLKVKPKL